MLYDFLSNVSANIIGSVIGGILLALLFFFGKEKWFRLHDIKGEWYFKTETLETGRRLNNGMIQEYIAFIWLEGHKIHGTYEKTFEDSQEFKGPFIGKDRARGVIDGYYEKNYLSSDCLSLHMVENGSREFTNWHDLHIVSSRKMHGNFTSTAARQKGKAEWQRDSFRN